MIEKLSAKGVLFFCSGIRVRGSGVEVKREKRGSVPEISQVQSEDPSKEGAEQRIEAYQPIR